MLSRPPRPGNATIAALCGIALMLLVGLAAGQDYNYDLINYHYSSAYLLLAGRMGANVAPSGVQSWFNPIGYVPAYLAIAYLPPKLAAALLAGVAGLNAPLIYRIADRIAGDLPPDSRARAAFACTLIGMTGAITLAEAGTSFLDVWLSLAGLGALLAAIEALVADGVRRMRLLALAGLLLGLICGIKPTCIVTAIGMAAALAVLAGRRRLPVAGALPFVAAGLLGVLLTGGWWAWRSWALSGNPVFPMANQLFRSPLLPARALNDTSFVPADWTGLVTYPWHWLIGDRTPGAETLIRDPRHAIGLVSALACLGFGWRRRTTGDVAAREAGLLTAAFALATYVVWLFGFAILRYVVLLEMLSGVLLLAALRTVTVPRLAPRTLATATIVAALLIVGWTRTGTWGRTHWSADWFGIRGATETYRPGTLYVIPDDAPLSFLLAALPADARLVHIGGNLPLDPRTGLGLRAATAIRAAPMLRSLAALPDDPDGVATLHRFGLVAVPGSCARIDTKVAPIESCVLRFGG